MPTSHRSPDTTKRSCLCRVGRCGLSLETVWQSLNSQLRDHLHRVTFSEKFRPSLVICCTHHAHIVLAYNVAKCARSASLRPPDALRRKPDKERTCLAVKQTQFTPPHQTQQNSPVCVVSGVTVWTETFALYLSRLQIFSRRQSWAVDNPV